MEKEAGNTLTLPFADCSGDDEEDVTKDRRQKTGDKGDEVEEEERSSKLMMDTTGSVAWRCAGKAARTPRLPSELDCSCHRYPGQQSQRHLGKLFLPSLCWQVSHARYPDLYIVSAYLRLLYLPSLTTARVRNNSAKPPDWRPTANS